MFKMNSSEDIWWYSSTHCISRVILYSELFWATLPRIRTGWREIRSISPYSVQMQENSEKNNSEYEHFLLGIDYVNKKWH